MSALVPLALSGQMSGQIAISSITTSDTQAMIQYASPVAAPCRFQVADMNRAISIVAISQGTGQVTMTTVAPHGLLAGAVIYLENSGVWNGWQTVASVPTASSFVFASTATGGTSGGTAGVLVDDVNPALFPGANLDSRAGSISTGQPTAPGQLAPLVQSAGAAGRNRTIVIGKRAADVASDGFRYSRALQTYSRHHLSLTCGTQTFDQDFKTANIPLGDTYNEGPPVDRNAPGQYSYPNVQWSNMAQSLIDPLTGLRSQRATGPAGIPSPPQAFQTAIDVQGAWQNAIAPLTNAVTAATYNGSCASGTCPLFLRADNLSINGGASYTQGGATTAGASLDWITVSVKQASISGACSGDDCKLEACLTVDGVTCASANQEAVLGTTPADLSFGSGKMMDLWQASGPPTISRVDVTQAAGTVNYKASTKQLTFVKGAPFNIRWGAGSQITVAGGAFTIASVQSEQTLTLTDGPNSDVTNVPYTANNFGVLLFKKTNSANAVSLGYATFSYAATVMPPYSPQASNYCSNIVTVNGVPGYNCFIDTELYWAAADGSDARDMGMAQLQAHTDGRWPNQYPCGKGQQLSQFDPQNGDIWYCMVPLFFDTNRLSIVQAHYIGSHARNTPGTPIPDCDLNNNAQPCIKYTIMQPKPQDSIPQSGPPFNPAFAASGYKLGGIVQGGISSDGDMLVYSIQGAQDTRGWFFVYTLGDRTPTGTTANSFRIIASASTFLTAPLSWCTIHSTEPPDGGWTQTVHNSFPIMGQAGNYIVTFTNGPLNNKPGDPNGLNACPANTLGVSGNVCTTVTIAGQPASALDGSQPQKLQVGDLMRISDLFEFVRVIAIASDTQITLQRGYPGPPTLDPAENHTSNVAIMNCGTYNNQSATLGLWNYRADPMGLNADGTTIKNNPTALGGHQYAGGGVAVTAGGFPYSLGEALCPQATLTFNGSCTQVIPGTLYAPTGPAMGVAVSPPFMGKVGIGSPNTVDSHPGPCFQGWCTDARPLDGGGPGNLAAGQGVAPWANVSGQLWKISGGQKVLNRKYLRTIAYVGRFPLVDISGPKSILGNSAKDSYKYCYAVAAGECSAGSAVGDVFVNSPHVSFPYCYYPGVAAFADDANAICVGDLGAYTGNVVQFGTSQQDVVGAVTRRLGTNYAKYNQMDVFWTASPVPSGQMMFTQARWLDGIRTDDLTSTMPPFPAPDGVVRNTFSPVQVKINVPQGLPAQSAIVEFGYVENGNSGSYFCTSRQEACVAAAGSVDPNAPFFFEQTETYTPQPCSNGCTIAVPALPEHVLYYRWRFIGANGQVIQSGPPQVTIVP
jgi:hypothetical protein